MVEKTAPAASKAKGLEGVDARAGAASRQLPVLPLRDTVYFPGLPHTLHVAREASVRALRKSLEGERLVLVLSQRDNSIEEPTPTDLYTVGTVCEVLQALPLPDTSLRASLRGVRRVRAEKLTLRGGLYVAKVVDIAETGQYGPETEALMRECVDLFAAIVHMSRTIPPESAQAVAHLADPGLLADSIAHHLPLRPAQKQHVLEQSDHNARLRELFTLLKREEEVLRLGQSIHRRVEEELGDSQREYYLREQLKAIQAELQLRENRLGESEEYLAKFESVGMPPAAREKAEGELRRLDRTPAASPEGLVARNYLDYLVSVPWGVQTEDRLDVVAAKAVLDGRHFGLQQVKERIVEQLAVRQLNQSLRGPVLCFVGPPGVGKTSIARSIAEAMGRKFARIAVGGVRDEAELRGHRRTYIGSMPGRIVQSLITCGSRNPVLVLDELDKIGMQGMGDPVAALLEILDPEQNTAFVDHYVDTPLDLSSILFIATANDLYALPAALRDRMEIVQFSGYTEREKVEIARTFLIPSALKAHGLTVAQFALSPEALGLLINDYTRESGARELSRQIEALTRKVARKVAEGSWKGSELDREAVVALLGTPLYTARAVSRGGGPGIATGLVVSAVGGGTVPIEVALTPAQSPHPQLRLTGNLGDIMKESAEAALTYVRSSIPGLRPAVDVHVHVPEGGTPKDGPSAGLAIAAALASAYLDRPLPNNWAMTGEITLRGRVLGIGGLREKLLAALRMGLTDVIIPGENRPSLDDLPEEVRAGVRIHPVDHAEEAFSLLGLSIDVLRGHAPLE